MPNYLLEKEILLPSLYYVNCKVSAKEGSALKDDYVLLIPEIGYGYQNMEPIYTNIVHSLKKEGKEIPNFIFFDPLSCGKSDSTNRENWTIDYFTEIAAQVVEVVKEVLEIPSMRLSVIGHSFGSLVALNFPNVRDWNAANSSIQLSQLISLSGPLSSIKEMQEKTISFLENTFPDLYLEEITESLKKLYAGNIKNRSEFIKNICLTLAPLNREVYDEFSPFLLLMGVFPKLLEWTTYLFSFNTFFGKLYYDFTGCNITVLNHFFADSFQNFDLNTVISENKERYQLPVYCLGGSKDYLSFYQENMKPLKKIFPDNLSFISFKEARHKDLPALAYRLIADIIVHDEISATLKNNSSMIERCQLAGKFHPDLDIKKGNIKDNFFSFAIEKFTEVETSDFNRIPVEFNT